MRVTECIMIYWIPPKREETHEPSTMPGLHNAQQTHLHPGARIPWAHDLLRFTGHYGSNISSPTQETLKPKRVG